MKQYNATRWKPLALNGAVLDGNLEGLIGIEECTNYELNLDQNKKRKIKDIPDSAHCNSKRKKRKRSSKNIDCNITPSKDGSTLDCDQINQSTYNESENTSMEAWNEYGLSKEILKGLSEQGFLYPTQIQSLSLPAAIFGKKDILGSAETGSGKTLAFGLPIINSILKLKQEQQNNKTCDLENGTVDEHPLYALILTPTRELAIQVKNHLQAVAKYSGISIAVVVGGMAAVKQERLLNKFPEIVVATPGRLWELIQLGYDHLTGISKIRFLVIDETDRMLEKGHFQELQSLLEKINVDETVKKHRQNFVFSATLTLVHDLPKYLVNKMKRSKKNFNLTPGQKLKTIIDTLGITDPKIVDITEGIGLSDTLTESRVNCSILEKDYYVYYFLQKHPGRTIIFCNSIGCVKRLATLFSLLECNPLPLHASMQQRQRLKNLEKFRDTENSILIATDVAARGLDIPCVEHVLHYQIPRTSEGYVHRSGRTARANKQGLTLLLIDSSELHNYIKVCKTLNKSEDIPAFPIEHNYLEAVKQRVNLARELDGLQLQVRRTNSEAGWFEKTAKEMDMIVDHMSKVYDSENGKKCKKLADIKRKHLSALLRKPIFPRGMSGKYPLLNNLDPSLEIAQQFEQSAIDAMKESLEKNKASKKKPISIYKPKKWVIKEHDLNLKKSNKKIK